MAAVQFEQAFTFAYSERSHTHARHKMRDDVHDDVKLRRLQELIAVFRAGAAAAGLAVKYWSATTSLAVVRCGRDAHRRVWASMTMLRDVKGRAVVARVLHNASTLRSSRAATRSRVEAAFARLVARGGMPGGASAAAAGTEAAKVAIDAMCE